MLGSKLSMVALASVFSLLPFVTPAHAQNRDDRRAPQEHRYYDTINRDYHPWNGDEDRRYRSFLDEHHRRYRDFSRLNKKQQREYWQWRHDHDDNRR